MSQCKKLFSVCAIFVYNVFVVTAFNVESKNYAIFNANGTSMFGFTTALHRERGNGWVLVGAPTAQSVYNRYEVNRGGAVYKCRPDVDNSCEEIPFDREPNHVMGQKIIDDKNNQWFGATLSTSGVSDGPIVACAPRYVWFTRDASRRDPVGTCYVSDGYFNKFEEYSPCRTANWGYHRQGSCQAGFSAAINSEGDRLYVGAPGSFYWQGQMYSIDAHATFNFTPGFIERTYGAKGSVHQQSLETRPAVFSTREGGERDDDSYMGYSSVIGHFKEDEEHQGIVVGMPRGASLRGKILFYTWNLNNYRNISCTSQIGSYFGYALAAADVDGDKKIDLIVGAPLHTEPNTGGKYDVGRVYVFYQNGGFDKSHIIDGFNSRSRFGHALAGLGDINQDGYDDFAVGAPYDEKGGAVYIYYGSSEGVLSKYGQVLTAEQFENYPSSYGLSTFGFSLAGGMDIDGNEYPDMVVGAYLSNAAFFLRSKPVIRVDAFVRFLTPNKQIDLKHKNCTLRNGQKGACTSIDFCVKYSGKGIPDSIILNVQYILDTKRISTPRLSFVENDLFTFNDTIRLQKDSKETCRTKPIYVKDKIRDKLTPLEAEVKYSLLEDEFSYREVRRNPRSVLPPVLDLNSPPSKKDSIIIQKNCGNDNICIPNLHVNATTNVEKYLLGSNTNLEFDITVSNSGEDAFETTFEMHYPEGAHFIKVLNKPNMYNILCTVSVNRTIKCDIGNPLPARKIARFGILLQTYHKDGMAPSYEFDLFVNSTNPEDPFTVQDNHKHVSIEIWIDSSIELTGMSFPTNVYFNASTYETDEIINETYIGPKVVHVYSLRNKGPAKIQEAEMFFVWPYYTFGGEDFLYILDQLYTLGNVKCDTVPANYKHYKLKFYTPELFWDELNIDMFSYENSDAQRLKGVAVESGEGIQGEIGGAKIHAHKKLDEEISRSGDASIVHQNRHESSSTFSRERGGGSSNSYVQGTGGSNTAYGSSGTITENGRVTTQTAKLYQEYVNGVPITRWRNTTIVKDAQGNIIDTHETIGDYGESSRQFASAENFGRGTGHRTSNVIVSSSGNSGRQGQRQYSSSDFTVSGNSPTIVEGKYPGNVHRGHNTVFDWGGTNSNRTYQQGGYQQYGGNRQYDSTSHQNAGGSSIRYQGGSSGSGQSSSTSNSETPSVFGYYDERGEFHSASGGQSQRNQNRSYSGQSRTTYGELDLNGQNGFREQPVGFTVTTFDLGTGGGADISGNVQQNRGQSTTSSGASGQHSFSSGGQQQWHRNEGSELSGSSSRTAGEGSNSDGGNRQEWHRESHWSRSGKIPATYFNVENRVDEPIGRDNVPTDKPNLNNMYHRGKRQANEYDEIRNLVPCKATGCLYLKCTVGELKNDEDVVVGIRSRLNFRVLKEIRSEQQKIKLSSMMLARISKLPFIGTPRERNLQSKEIFTEIPAIDQPELKPSVVPLWVVVLSAVAGTLALLLLVLILYKFGFFKRDRPSSAPERQPLNKNGYHHGDEAL